MPGKSDTDQFIQDAIPAYIESYQEGIIRIECRCIIYSLIVLFSVYLMSCDFNIDIQCIST